MDAIRFILNDKEVMYGGAASDRLLDVLRDTYDMKSVKCGCKEGECGACAVLSKHPHPTEEEVREGLSGNLCRCTGYNAIVNAVLNAAKEGEGLW